MDVKQFKSHCYKIGSKSYIKQMDEWVKEILEVTTLKKLSTPSIEDFHPEIDNSELLNKKGINNYQRPMGIAQWLVSINKNWYRIYH